VCERARESESERERERERASKRASKRARARERILPRLPTSGASHIHVHSDTLSVVTMCACPCGAEGGVSEIKDLQVVE